MLTTSGGFFIYIHICSGQGNLLQETKETSLYDLGGWLGESEIIAQIIRKIRELSGRSQGFSPQREFLLPQGNLNSALKIFELIISSSPRLSRIFFFI